MFDYFQNRFKIVTNFALCLIFFGREPKPEKCQSKTAGQNACLIDDKMAYRIKIKHKAKSVTKNQAKCKKSNISPNL